MAKQHKKKVKGTELDGLIKKMLKMSEKVVSETMKKREAIEKYENEKAKLIQNDDDFIYNLAGSCENSQLQENDRLCERTNCTCRMGFCPIMKRIKK